MHILTLDMGTSGLKCTLFRRDGSPVQARVEPYGSAYPRPGWAQQDPNAYLHAATRAARAVMAASGILARPSGGGRPFRHHERHDPGGWGGEPPVRQPHPFRRSGCGVP